MIDRHLQPLSPPNSITLLLRLLPHQNCIHLYSSRLSAPTLAMRTLVGFYILCLLLGQDLPFLLADDVNFINDSTQNLCFATRLSDFLPPPYGNISDSMPCTPLWNTFVLRVNFKSHSFTHSSHKSRQKKQSFFLAVL